MNAKPVIFVLSLVAGLGMLATTGIMGAAATPAPAHVVTIPEVTIMGEIKAPAVINLPEMVIPAAPTGRQRSVKAPKVQGRNLVHTLRQGGSPMATTVRAWGM